MDRHEMLKKAEERVSRMLKENPKLKDYLTTALVRNLVDSLAAATDKRVGEVGGEAMTEVATAWYDATPLSTTMPEEWDEDTRKNARMFAITGMAMALCNSFRIVLSETAENGGAS